MGEYGLFIYVIKHRPIIILLYRLTKSCMRTVLFIRNKKYEPLNHYENLKHTFIEVWFIV